MTAPPSSLSLPLISAAIQLVATAVPGGEFSLSHAGSSAHTAVVVHGVIMILAWLVLLPTGVGEGAAHAAIYFLRDKV